VFKLSGTAPEVPIDPVSKVGETVCPLEGHEDIKLSRHGRLPSLLGVAIENSAPWRRGHIKVETTEQFCSSKVLPVRKSPKPTSTSHVHDSQPEYSPAYARSCWQFFDWCAAHALELTLRQPS
jgi:hypothetical protein